MSIGDRIEQACAHWLALPVFTALFILGILIIGVDPTNIVVSYMTIALLLLTVGRDRRDRLAMHTKLDDLERAVPTANGTKARLEERSEEEINANR